MNVLGWTPFSPTSRRLASSENLHTADDAIWVLAEGKSLYTKLSRIQRGPYTWTTKVLPFWFTGLFYVRTTSEQSPLLCLTDLASHRGPLGLLSAESRPWHSSPSTQTKEMNHVSLMIYATRSCLALGLTPRSWGRSYFQPPASLSTQHPPSPSFCWHLPRHFFCIGTWKTAQPKGPMPYTLWSELSSSVEDIIKVKKRRVREEERGRRKYFLPVSE